MGRVLVTGCAGFIGSHVVDALLSKGQSVLGIDRFSDYYSPRQKERNLEIAGSHRSFRLVRGDLNDLDVVQLLDGVTHIIHLAAQAGVRAGPEALPSYVRDNILATQRLLEAAARSGVEKVVFASSSSVYGNGRPPFREDAPLSPLSTYGMTKLVGERLCEAYQLAAGLPIVRLRYFTVYGPRQRPDMSFHLFIKALLEQRPLSIFGDGEQRREWTYVSDVVEATLTALHSPATGAFNVSGGSSTSLKSALHILERLTGRTALVTFLPPAEGDVRETASDTTRAHEVLGYRPRVGIEEGLAKEIAWLTSLTQ